MNVSSVRQALERAEVELLEPFAELLVSGKPEVWLCVILCSMCCLINESVQEVFQVLFEGDDRDLTLLSCTGMILCHAYIFCVQSFFFG